MALQELTRTQVFKITDSSAPYEVASPQGLADRYSNVSRDEKGRATVFRSPATRPGDIDTTIYVPDVTASFIRSQGDVHVIDWRNGTPRGVLRFSELQLQPRQPRP